MPSTSTPKGYPPPVNADRAAAWSFILQHSALIERMSGRFFAKLKDEDKEDARADLVQLIVERHPTLRLDGAHDPQALIVTWIGWQCLRVQKSYCRRYHKVLAREVVMAGGTKDAEPTEVLVLMPATGYGSQEHVEQSVRDMDVQETVAELYATATPKQREAMLTVLAEMPADEMRARFGLTVNARNDRLKTLRANVRAATT